MNKSDLIKEMVNKTNLSKPEAKKALEAFLESVQTAVSNGERVSLVGFGTFGLTKKEQRTGMNPSTQEQIIIPAKKVVKFKAGTEFAEKVK